MSSLITSNISDGTTSVPTGYVVNGSAKAWVNFNGTGTAVIRESLNISSLTDNATGDFRTSFTSSMANADFSICSATDQNGVAAYNFQGVEVFGSQSVDYVAGLYRPNTGSDVKADVSRIRRAIHGELA